MDWSKVSQPLVILGAVLISIWSTFFVCSGLINKISPESDRKLEHDSRVEKEKNEVAVKAQAVLAVKTRREEDQKAEKAEKAKLKVVKEVLKGDKEARLLKAEEEREKAEEAVKTKITAVGEVIQKLKVAKKAGRERLAKIEGLYRKERLALLEEEETLREELKSLTLEGGREIRGKLRKNSQKFDLLLEKKRSEVDIELVEIKADLKLIEDESLARWDEIKNLNKRILDLEAEIRRLKNEISALKAEIAILGL
ncbi:MAG: hypothetical protein A2908_01085 [Candidatus Staskawiczbacteria bacterium RIFCSPLOWO2_01_FULL_38_12b]|uniref:Uncharacterized protein n=1 Tax=Candidatus Staskawiczbacteria bacterium RIFCSPLOWO2_01_FULL_38_12b TaxID=1802214 RepID=A0A1G2IG23_9BACT|nr:MAG: hypothetical protein A2908_01085 [Candidatus Staskawiczbacteria bacterium RIFCSPLOWO2_01_FULL_38_12b]